MIRNRIYPAKILLFGEYTIIEGSDALAIPIGQFSGMWSSDSGSSFDLAPFKNYLYDLQKSSKLKFQIDIASFDYYIQNGLNFQSDIPVGYGLGSSGALSAAVYDTFAIQKETDLNSLKAIFAQLESFFHGSSSGIDPLICYINQAVHINQNDIFIEPIPKLAQDNYQLFLYNTQQKRKTDALVNWFVEQCRNTNYQNLIHAELLPLVAESIATIRNKEFHLLFESFHQISHFQLRYFQPMIPKTIKSIWLEGLSSNLFKLKLCGAGGGGFFLGITKDIEALKNKYDSYIIPL